MVAAGSLLCKSVSFFYRGGGRAAFLLAVLLEASPMLPLTMPPVSNSPRKTTNLGLLLGKNHSLPRLA